MSQVEYILGLWRPHSGHSVGINAVANGSDLVLSGGRDGRVCGWQPNAVEPSLQYDAHTDWVNSLLQTDGQIWSCSADTTVKCYNNGSLHLVGAHKDYVKCLAKCGGGVLSGGLDGQVMSWSPEGQLQFQVQMEGEMNSVYALAGHENHFVSGGPDSIVRLWDSRQATSAVQTFTGHSDNVRSLLVNDEWIVSASSDSSVRLWNMRAGRLFKAWNNYTDSVFSLYSTDSTLESFYSGDRMGHIYFTSRDNPSSPFVVAQQPDAVWGIVHQEGLWTSGHALRYWDMKQQQQQQPQDSPSPTATPVVPKPSVELEPHTSLVKTTMLNDKRRVLAAASDGGVALIDFIQGFAIEKLTSLDPDNIGEQLVELAEKHNTMDVLDNWCQVGVRAGKLVISLDERSAGVTEVYADDLAAQTGHDLGETDDERRINLGKWTLQALFAKFAKVELPRLEKARSEFVKEATPEPAPEPGPAKKEKSKFSRMFSLRKSSRTEEKDKRPSSPTTGALPGAGHQNHHHNPQKDKHENYNEAFEAAVELDDIITDTAPFEAPEDTRILISERAPGCGAATAIFDSTVAELDTPEHVEQLRELLPGWVGEALWLPKMSSRAPARIGFNVVPFSDEYPDVSQSKGRLLANPVLRARKAMAYVISSLKEVGHLKDADGPSDEYIELFCQGEPVPPLMTLAMIRTRLWRSGGDVVLHYKIKDRSQPKNPFRDAPPTTTAESHSQAPVRA